MAIGRVVYSAFPICEIQTYRELRQVEMWFYFPESLYPVEELGTVVWAVIARLVFSKGRENNL